MIVTKFSIFLAVGSYLNCAAFLGTVHVYVLIIELIGYPIMRMTVFIVSLLSY